MYIGFILNGRNNLEYCRMLSSDANDLDRRFGEFCFSQVRKQLKGACPRKVSTASRPPMGIRTGWNPLCGI